jgi:hypothetical protein
MSRQSCLKLLYGAALLGLVWSFALVDSATAQAPAAPAAKIQSFLDAGEFGAALTAAREAPAAQRDALLAQIASAQTQAGATSASLRSIAEIQNDRYRTDSISNMKNQPVGRAGTGVNADFDSLIDMITTTVKPDIWEQGGGAATIKPFQSGVLVDGQGTLRLAAKQDSTSQLDKLRAASTTRVNQESARKASPFRMVSLPRLEKYVQLCLAAGNQPTEDMLVLAGLRRISHVFVYPESGDIVLAGPAGDWTVNSENRAVSVETGEPVLLLDDVVAVLRQIMQKPDAQFGCLIVPRQQGLANLQQFMKETGKRTLMPGQRAEWLATLRSRLGKQDIEVFGIDARTHAARVMVEADYRMKLVGMGLEAGVPGVKSYLASISSASQNAQSMSVLRWWFEMNYDAVVASKDGLAFEFRGQGVKVVSENEHLTPKGERVHTGESEELNRQFAASFTEHFAALAAKYPVYAELRNIFDIALMASLLRTENFTDKVGWHLTCFGNPNSYQVAIGPAPKEVDSVVNARAVNDSLVVAGVSGGVTANPMPLVSKTSIKVEDYQSVGSQRETVAPKDLALEAWWWD